LDNTRKFYIVDSHVPPYGMVSNCAYSVCTFLDFFDNTVTLQHLNHTWHNYLQKHYILPSLWRSVFSLLFLTQYSYCLPLYEWLSGKQTIVFLY